MSKQYTINSFGTVIIAPAGSNPLVTIGATSVKDATMRFLVAARHVLSNQPKIHFHDAAWTVVSPSSDGGFDTETGIIGSPKSLMQTHAKPEKEALDGCTGYYGTLDHLEGHFASDSGKDLQESLRKAAAQILAVRGSIDWQKGDSDAHKLGERLSHAVREVFDRPVVLDSHWDDHPDWPVRDWQAAVQDGDTRQSYVAWVIDMISSAVETAAEDKKVGELLEFPNGKDS
jgi:hypothetical protein